MHLRAFASRSLRFSPSVRLRAAIPSVTSLAAGAAVLLTFAAFAPRADAQSAYKFIRLSAPVGYSSGGYGVNDAGHVVGITQAGGGYATAFYWSDANNDSTFQPAEMQSLGTFGGSYSEAKAINHNDVVVGRAAIPGNTDAHAYIWKPGQGPLISALNDLNNLIDSTLPSGWILQSAFDINDSGVIAVSAEEIVTNPDSTTSKIYHPGILRPAATQPGLYSFTDLTSGFQIRTTPDGGGVSSTGAAVIRGNSYNSLFWDGTSSASAATMNSVYAMNAAGTIIGWSQFGSYGHAAVTEGPNGAVQDLGTLGGTSSRAWDINDGALSLPTTVGTAKVIVTAATRAKPAVQADHAFRWQGSGSLTDLNAFVTLPSASKPGKSTVLWYLMAAYAISPNGTIVGISGDGGSTNPNYAFLLIPTAP